MTFDHYMGILFAITGTALTVMLALAAILAVIYAVAFLLEVRR